MKRCQDLPFTGSLPEARGRQGCNRPELKFKNSILVSHVGWQGPKCEPSAAASRGVQQDGTEGRAGTQTQRVWDAAVPSGILTRMPNAAMLCTLLL